MNVKKEQFKVYDMTCSSCETRVEKSLTKLQGMINAKASYNKQLVIVEYDIDLCSINQIKSAIVQAGYSVNNSKIFKVFGIFIIAVVIILMGLFPGGFDMEARLKGASYITLFIIGLLSSIHCAGMCGGIMLTQSISRDESSGRFDAVKPSILYNLGRVISYTLLGGILGGLVQLLSKTTNAQNWMPISLKAGIQISASVFMIAMGLSMSGFSLLRKLHIRLPWSSCTLKRKVKMPLIVGLLNGLMPCGPLQIMQGYALLTGSAIYGALSMFAFSLGTLPLMLTFGALSGMLSKGYTKIILKFGGIMVVVLGLIMASHSLSLLGVNINLKKALVAFDIKKAANTNIPKMINGVQVIKTTADSTGCSPDVLFVKKNIPVKWIIDCKELTSCDYSIIIPSLNIQKYLERGQNIIEFTPKDKDISYTCWMGMISGTIKVTDNIDTALSEQ